MNISKISFQNFLLNENKVYLGVKVGDILTAIQDLQQNSKSMGARQLAANCERIVNQIRRILHSNWSPKEEKHLLQLQKVGVALAKAVEEKDNLIEILPSVTSELEKISGRLGTPLNSLGQDSTDQKSPPVEESPAQETYVKCINSGDCVDLMEWKNYKLVPSSEAPQFLRVIDDSGEDFLYPAGWFEKV